MSGWFRWTAGYSAEWNSLFYLSINAKADWADGQKLGDRVLGCVAHSSNYYTSLTYKYDNMNGAGNANANQRVAYTADKISAWHFIYHGYNKNTAQSFFFIKWSTDSAKHQYDAHRHYFAEKFYFLMRPQKYGVVNGQIALVNVVLGKGAFKIADDYTADPDTHKFVEGSVKLSKPVAKVDVSTPAGQTLTSSLNSKPTIDVEHTSDRLPTNINEYGYGFWLKFYTHFPERMWSGRN